MRRGVDHLDGFEELVKGGVGALGGGCAAVEVHRSHVRQPRQPNQACCHLPEQETWLTNARAATWRCQPNKAYHISCQQGGARYISTGNKMREPTCTSPLNARTRLATAYKMVLILLSDLTG